MRLKDRIALVIGAGQTPGDTIGNGRATAVRFAQEGAKVFLTDINAEQLAQAKTHVEDEGGECASHVMDVRSESDTRAAVRSCLDTYGRIDILHHNVGIAGRDGPPHRLDLALWEEMMAVNTTGFFLTAKHVVPVMREQKSGCIIAISSIAAWWTINSAIAYKASKAAMNAMVQSMAVDNARHGIRVNAILPGLMDTPIAIEATTKALGKTSQEVRALRNAKVPLNNEMGTAWDIANAAVFLASDEAKFITGVLLPVDGGQSARVG